MKIVYIILITFTLFACKKNQDKEIQLINLDKFSILINDSVDVKSIIAGDSLKFSVAEKFRADDTKYLWILNGATPSTSNLSMPKVKYKTEGEYDVRLIVVRGSKTDTLVMPKLIKVESTIMKGLIAYYPFNGNSIDMTGNGHDGVSMNAVLTTDRFGNRNSAYSFNGTSSAIEVKDKPDLRLSQTDFTINLWTMLNDYDASHVSSLLMKRFFGLNNGWVMSVNGYAALATPINSVGTSLFIVSGGGDPYAVGNKKVVLNTWCMLSTVYNLKQKTISFYFNGKLDRVVPNMPSPNGSTNANLLIGSDNFNTGSTGYHINGKIDDIGFYNRILSEQEINRIYFNSNTSNPPVFEQ
jgi:PKD repeat protein